MKTSGQKPTSRAPTQQGKIAAATQGKIAAATKVAKRAQHAPAAPARAPVQQGKSVAATKVAKRAQHAPAGTARARSAFADVYLASPTDRIHLIRSGVQAKVLLDTGARMGVSKEGILTLLKLPRSTVTRHLQAERVLPTDFSERFLGLQQLIGQVEVMVGESGDPAGFDAAHWVAGWLERPLPALNNAKPADYMDTMQGQMLVASLLASMQSGAFA